MEKILTKEDYLKILQERFKTSNVEFVNVEWKDLSENIEGFLGDHYIIKITYKIADKVGEENFFIKTKPNKTESQIALANDLNSYEKEIFLYSFLFREYEKMGYDTTFAPKCYYCKGNQTLVMEDLKAKDYQLFPRGDFFDIYHCKAALEALACYHGNAIAYEETKSKTLGRRYNLKEEFYEKLKEPFFKKIDEAGLSTRFMQSSFGCFKYISKYLTVSEEWKDSFMRRLDNLDYVKTFWTPSPCRKTCGHGDLWSNNMLFQYNNGKPPHCCLVDYQILRYQYPAYDALLVVYTNTESVFRKKHLQELLEWYYATLESVLKKYGLEVRDLMPKENFLDTTKFLKIVALVQAAAVRILTLLPAEVLNITTEEGVLEDLWYSETYKVKLIKDAIENSEEYKKAVTNDVYDLGLHLIKLEELNLL